MKDNFSGHSPDYARYRPDYPEVVFDFIYSHLDSFDTAWDCATGNGQIAVKLAERFNQVYASDLSANQLAQAPARSTIIYRTERAEENSFGNQQFDLITVGQAIHWFDFGVFFRKADRTLKPGGLLALLGYPLLTVNDAVDTVIHKLYADTLDNYWDPERRYIEDRYRTIPFPFQEIAGPEFTQSLSWSYAELVGYLNTWSAVKHYSKQHATNPVDQIEPELRRAWGAADCRTVHFPIILRVGRKQ